MLRHTTTLLLLLGTIAAHRDALAASRTTATTVAPARIYFLDADGHRIERTRAKRTIQFVLQFAMPRSFPTGYTDLRFTVYVHGRAQRTIIYGTPKRVVPGETLRVAVPVPVSRAWVGQAKVVGTVTLLSRPAGVSIYRMGRGVAILTVTR